MGHLLTKNEKMLVIMLQKMLTKSGFPVSAKMLNEFIDQDFVSRLEEAVNRMLPPSEGTDMLLKQLAWENANPLCQDLIRPIRKTGTVSDYIKACLDASPALVQGMAYAAAMKGQKFSAYVKKTYGGGAKKKLTCHSCGDTGHMQRHCPSKKDPRKKDPPGLCPRCKKGKHWRNECKSKFHKDGTPLTDSKKEEDGKN